MTAISTANKTVAELSGPELVDELSLILSCREAVALLMDPDTHFDQGPRGKVATLLWYLDQRADEALQYLFAHTTREACKPYLDALKDPLKNQAVI